MNINGYNPYKKGFDMLVADMENHENIKKSQYIHQMALAARRHLDANELAQCAYWLDQIIGDTK